MKDGGIQVLSRIKYELRAEKERGEVFCEIFAKFEKDDFLLNLFFYRQ